ncbi:MAG: hypothetical protein ACXVEE_23870 [Polyangiales bacterium]
MSDEQVCLRAGDASFTISRLRPGVVLAIGGGHDKGDFGDAVLHELERAIHACPPVEIFCDVTEVFDASQVVSERWANWLRDNRMMLRAVHVLTASKYVHLTVSIAKLISRTGELMRIHTEPRGFEDAVARAIGRTFSLAEARRQLAD